MAWFDYVCLHCGKEADQRRGPGDKRPEPRFCSRACSNRYHRLRQPCGTAAAYKRHRRDGEEACDPCKAAWAAMIRERKLADGRQVSVRVPVALIRELHAGNEDAIRQIAQIAGLVA